MTHKAVITDQNLLEKIQYQNHAIPISFYEDHFDDYSNGEVNYHWHEEFEFGLILKGEAKYDIHHSNGVRECQILKEGDGMFVNSRALHSAKQTVPGTVMFDFVFPANFFLLLHTGAIYKKDIIPLTQSPVPGLFLLSKDKADTEILESLQEFYHLSSDAVCYELHCIELVCRIWRQLLFRITQIKDFPDAPETKRVPEQRVRLMLSYIHTHYGEDITIRDIAEAANIGRSECFRCFRTVIGKTPSEYLCSYRLSQASHILTNTDTELSAICFSCGFNSPSYFGKLFKKNFGMSPGQYRLLSKNKSG